MEFPRIPNSLFLQQGEEVATLSSKLPEEIYQEILIRLPVKSVLISKSVCKSWYSQISNPNFVKLHLNQNKNNSSSDSSLLLGIGDDLHSIGYDSLVSSREIEEGSSVRMRYPFKLQIQCVRLLGSCNGLVFLQLYGYSVHYDDERDFLCVWNPATREYKKIPESPSISFKDICINGLVYDGKNDDYKFVIGADGDTSELTTSLEIFSLKSNAWETILTPYWSAYGEWKTGVLVNGNLHWLAKGECGGCIVYLDISYGMPSFKEIQLPTVQNLEFFSVGVLEEGCLCVLADNGDIGLARVEVWEMQVYGVRESWTRRYVIANHTITTSVMVEESGWRTIWSFKKGKIIFVDSQKVVLYDPKHRTAIERNLNRLAYFTSVVNHVESLVSLSSGTYVGQN